MRGTSQTCSLCEIEKPLSDFSKRSESVYRKDCRICVNARTRALRARSEAMRAREREYRLSRSVELKEYAASWYQRNRDKRIATATQWAANNREAYRANMRASAARRAARLRALPCAPYSLADLIERDGTACVLCGDDLDFDAAWPGTESVTVEHLEPISWPDSAGDVPDNVALAHWRCNNSRKNRPHPRAAAKRTALLEGLLAAST